MSIEVNGTLILNRVDLAALAASGPIGTPAATVDLAACLGVSASAAGLAFTLPTPTSIVAGRQTTIQNTGAVNSFTIGGVTLAPGNQATFGWAGAAWKADAAQSANDFWRDATGGIPDGANDTTEGIVHAGPMNVGASGLAGAASTHQALVQYYGNGTFATQVIQTQIPALTPTMPTIDIRGYVYGQSAPIDITASMYVYNTPPNAILNTGWTSNGAYKPLRIRAGYNGGFLALEVTWPTAENFTRYDVSCFAGGQSEPNSNYVGWTVANTDFTALGTANIVTIADKSSVGSGRVGYEGLLRLDGRVMVSRSGEVRWTNRFIVMSLGINAQRAASGFHDVTMPADGTAITVVGGTTRAVVASARATEESATGGVLLNAWEGLWYRLADGSMNTFSAANFRIQPYTAASAIDATLDDGWVLVAFRDGTSNTFHFGDGGKLQLGGQYGYNQPVQSEVYRRQSQILGLAGYVFSPWGAAVGTFGFNGTFRAIGSQGVGGAVQQVSTASYIDITPAAVGTTIYGWNGASNLTWRAATAADQFNRMGAITSGENALPATPTVCDLTTYDQLYFAPSQAGTTTGTWYRARYENVGSPVPAHWILIAALNIGAATAGRYGFTLWNGEYLQRGQALYRGDDAATQDSLQKKVTSAGQYNCRFTGAGFFAGTAANGLGTAGATSGVLISWPDNTLMWGMNGTYGGSGSTSASYLWLNIPAAGTAIPMLDTAGTRTRVVQTIGGYKYIPLAPWEALLYVPPQGSIAGSSAPVAGWVVTNYGDTRYVPPNAITVAQFAAPGGITGTGVAKTRVLMADGVYISPGVTTAGGTPTNGDQSHGSYFDTTNGEWRAVVIPGGTPPGGTVMGAAVAGLSLNGAAYRYVGGQAQARGTIELRGAFTATAAIPDGTLIGFLPGVQASTVTWLNIVARHAANNAVPATAYIDCTNTTQGGQSGVSMFLYGYSSANINVANGGAYGATGQLMISGHLVPHL